MRWQSWLVLAMVVPWCTISALRYALTQWSSAAKMALGISLALTLLVFLARAATLAAALTGGVLTAVVTLGLSPWYQSGLPSLLSLFVLTWTATRFGRSKKERLGVAEDKRGRNAAQVAANLGVAGLAATLALGHPLRGTWYALMMIAALAEATADTLASELGEVLGGPPLLLTTLRRVAPGTDGAISLAGTVAGNRRSAPDSPGSGAHFRTTAWRGCMRGIGGDCRTVCRFPAGCYGRAARLAPQRRGQLFFHPRGCLDCRFRLQVRFLTTLNTPSAATGCS